MIAILTISFMIAFAIAFLAILFCWFKIRECDRISKENSDKDAVILKLNKTIYLQKIEIEFYTKSPFHTKH